MAQPRLKDIQICSNGNPFLIDADTCQECKTGTMVQFDTEVYGIGKGRRFDLYRCTYCENEERRFPY